MFKGHVCKGCTCGSQCSRFQGCVLGQLWGVSGIHMSEDFFWIGRGYRVETLQNERECLELRVCIKTCVSICLKVSTQAVSEGYKSLGIVLLAMPWFY